MTALTHKENDLHNRLIVAEFNLQQVEAELRRLHKVNAELVEALEKISMGGDPRWANDALERLNKAAEDNGEPL